ncbi:MAG TPA: ABC transporter ATP-binding protein [Gemmatimonadaceae bacterium]|jgi:molybdopterin-binding protein
MISAAGLTARVGAFALADVTFDVPRGAYGVVIGPTGSGKTTLLEVISGLIPQTGGFLSLDDRDATHEPADARNIGLVYQHGVLFPHLSVEQNVGYGARSAAFADEVSGRFGLRELYARSVRSLSGGERQLVALARALARRPSVLLLDEPFSALDPSRRVAARREIRAVHREWGLTTLHVTHDFAEAGSLGDIAVLLDAGRVLQAGPPTDVFRRPASPYVAEFLGAENVFAGEVVALAGSNVFRSGALSVVVGGAAPAGKCHAIVRAEEILISRSAPEPSSARNRFEGRVTAIASAGALWRVTIDVSGTPLIAALTTYSADELELKPGDTAFLTFKATAVHLC